MNKYEAHSQKIKHLRAEMSKYHYKIPALQKQYNETLLEGFDILIAGYKEYFECRRKIRAHNLHIAREKRYGKWLRTNDMELPKK